MFACCLMLKTAINKHLVHFLRCWMTPGHYYAVVIREVAQYFIQQGRSMTLALIVF
ncbi:hypothetical protein O203_16830 [Ectopseudomonas chengduensis]|nr:hypothetical protein O203_16830 [Pseudomonas chengduensis]